MNNFIRLPYFNEDSGKICYLDQCEVLDIGGLSADSDLANKLMTDEGVIIRRRMISKKNKPSGKLLVVEPHPDDFALSSSGYALMALSEGYECKVLNLFSKTAVDNFPWKNKLDITERELEKLRLLESRLAIEDYLGEEFESFNLPMATLRGNKEIIVSKHEGADLTNSIAETLIKKISKENYDVVLCPLGIQGHIDHLVAFEAAVTAYKKSKRSFNLIFYQEYPYARNHQALSDRLQRLKELAQLQPLYIDVGGYVEQICDMISIYRSQFDDINRHQMLAVIKEDFRAIGAEATDQSVKGSREFMQKYYKLKKLL